MNIKRNIIFALEGRKKNGVPIIENVPIRMRVIFNSKRIEFTTGYRIDVAKWDADKQRVKNGCTNKLRQSAADINAALLSLYSLMQEIFKEFEVRDVMPTMEDIKTAFNNRLRPQEDITEDLVREEKSFWQIYKEFVQECGKQNNWTDSTYEKFTAVKNHILNFRPEPSFADFDEAGLTEYVDYLQKECDMRNSTIGKQLGF